MDLIERFRYVMKLNNMTASVFADEIGVQRSSVSHILSGRNKPSLEFIQKVIKRFPKVDSSWLISGSTSLGNQKAVKEEKPNIEIAESKEALSLNKSKEDNKSNQVDSLSKKTISKVLIFYTDGTFEEFKQS